MLAYSGIINIKETYDSAICVGGNVTLDPKVVKVLVYHK